MNREVKQAVIVGLIFLVMAAAAGWVAYTTKEELEVVEGEITALKSDIDRLTKEVALLPALQQELQSIEENLANYIKILPSPLVATEERLLDLVQEKCERAQFSPSDYRAKPARKGKAGSKNPFQEIDVTITAKGTYDQFLAFLNALERHETFLRVNSFTCSVLPAVQDPEKGEIWPLNITLNVSTFRYEAGK